MGFDIKALIAKVEAMVQQEDGSAVNGKIDTPKEASIFRDELNKAVQNQELTAENANEIFGLYATDSQKSANGTKGGAKGGVNIYIDASTHLNISIEVKNNIDEVIRQLLEAINNLSGKMDDIINVINGNQENLIYFLRQLFHQYLGNLGSDMSSIRDLLTQILSQVEINGQHVGNIEELMHQLLELELTSQGILLGLRDDAKAGFARLIELIEQNNASQEQQTEWLSLIYDVINQFKNEQGLFNADFKTDFAALMEMVDAGNLSLQDIIALLQAIKNDTSEGNQLSRDILAAINNLGAGAATALTAILNAINEGNAQNAAGIDDLKALLQAVITAVNNNTLNDNQNTQRILDAIGNLVIEGGQIDLSSIEAMLAQLLTLVGQGNNTLTDIDAKMGLLNMTINAMRTILEGMDIPNYEDILEDILEALGGNSYDDSQVLAMLQAILNAILECCGCDGGHGTGGNEGQEGDGELGELEFSVGTPKSDSSNVFPRTGAGAATAIQYILDHPGEIQGHPATGGTTGGGQVGIDEVIEQAKPIENGETIKGSKALKRDWPQSVFDKFGITNDIQVYILKVLNAKNGTVQAFTMEGRLQGTANLTEQELEAVFR